MVPQRLGTEYSVLLLFALHIHCTTKPKVVRAQRRWEVAAVMDDMRSADVDFITIGQYLRPTQKHLPMVRYVPPEEFDSHAATAREKGFAMVAASPLTRSSYHADEDFARLVAARSGGSRPEE